MDPLTRIQNKMEKMLEAAEKELEDFNRWLESLSDHDRRNFEMLVQLPTAPKVVASMAERDGEGEYVRWAVFALGMAGRAEELKEALEALE